MTLSHENQVVQNVIKHCDPKELVPIATTGCQFMEEVNVSTRVCESEHNYKNNVKQENKVHIPNAVYLTIHFDSK